MIQPSSTYLYQRSGVYYFRLRIRQSNNDRMTSVSLRTKDRRTAMSHFRHIKAALKAIHADRPDVTYEDMRGHLKDIAEWELSAGRPDLFEPDMRDLYRDQYGEAQIAVMVTVCEFVSRGANLLIDDAIFLHKFVEIIRDENVHFGTACPCESS